MQQQKGKQFKGSVNLSTEFFINFVNDRGFPVPAINRDDRSIEGYIKKRLADTSKVPEARSKLRKLLDKIIEDQELKDSEELQYFIKVSEQSIPKYKVENGKLVRSWQIGRGVERLFYADWLRDLSFDLTNFLTDPKRDIRKIKKCQVCNNYFISRHIKRPYCYENEDCKMIYTRSYHKKDMQKRRDPGSDKFDSKYM